MNVNVTVELEIITCQHHFTTGCFYVVHIFCVNKVFNRDLLRARFRVSESVNLVVSKESITDHSNQLLMLWLSQLSSVKSGECPTFHA